MSITIIQRSATTALALTLLAVTSPLSATEPGPEHHHLPPQLWTVSRNVRVQLPPRPIPKTLAEFSLLPLSPTLLHAWRATLPLPPGATDGNFDFGRASATDRGTTALALTPKPSLIVSDGDTSNVSSADSPHEVTEPAVMESRTFNRNTRSYNYKGYTAFMRFNTPNPAPQKSLIRIATTSDFVSWSLAPFLDLGTSINNTPLDQSGDPQIASHPYDSGLHPYRVYCVGTTYNAQLGSGDSQIAVWYTDNAGASWQRYAGINPRTGSVNSVDADDKPTVAVSWNTATFGYAYVAFSEVTSAVQIHVYALNPVTDQWEFRATPVTGLQIQCPRLDVNPTDGTLYLTWVDWQYNQIGLSTSANQGASWSAPKMFAAGQLLGPSSDLISTSTTNRVEARSMIMTRFNKAVGSLEVVYHIRQGTNGAMVMENRFVSGSWGSPIPVSSKIGHDQWNGAIDCAPDGTCVVSFYDYDRPTGLPITYFLYGRRLYATPAENDTLLYKSTEASDPSRYTPDNNTYFLGEYQDIWYYDWNGVNFNGVWNAGSIYIQNGDNKGDARLTRAQ